jgi:hypothetical protein
VLESNEVVRQDIVRLNSKMLVYEKELAFNVSQTLLIADEVRTKQQFLDSISMGFTIYHKKLILLKQLYE